MIPSRGSRCHLVEAHTMCESMVSYFLTLDSTQASCINLAPMVQYSDSPRAGRSGDRIPLRASFSAPVQTGPGAHPVTYIRDAGLLPGVKRPGRGIDHPPPSRAKVNYREEIYVPLLPVWVFVARYWLNIALYRSVLCT